MIMKKKSDNALSEIFENETYIKHDKFLTVQDINFSEIKRFQNNSRNLRLIFSRIGQKLFSA